MRVQACGGRPVALAMMLVVTLAVAGLGAKIVRAQLTGVYSMFFTIPIEATTAWTIDSLWHLAWYDELSHDAPLAEADARLILKDVEGRVLGSQLIARGVICVDPLREDCVESDAASAEISADARIHRVELHRIDERGQAVELKAVRERSPHAPELRIISPKPGEELRDGAIIEWAATDADGDAIKYYALYRWRGDHQRPLALDTPETRITFHRGSLAGGGDVAIAVLANDGFNTVEASVGGLKVGPDLLPQVYISSPRDGDAYPEGSNILLLASAHDPEDDELPVTWTSDRDGRLPDNPNWPTGSRGRHILTASATDSAGQTTSERVTIYVGVDQPAAVAWLPWAGVWRGTR